MNVLSQIVNFPGTEEEKIYNEGLVPWIQPSAELRDYKNMQEHAD